MQWLLTINVSPVRVEIPALDRLVTYLDGKEQAHIDALAKQVRDLTDRMSKSNTGLTAIVTEENKTNGS